MMDGGWWHWGLYGSRLFLGCLAFLFVIALLALVAWLIIRLVRASSSRAAAPGVPPIAAADPVLETLRRRLAEGAITAQEFDELRQKLGV